MNMFFFFFSPCSNFILQCLLSLRQEKEKLCKTKTKMIEMKTALIIYSSDILRFLFCPASKVIFSYMFSTARNVPDLKNFI